MIEAPAKEMDEQRFLAVGRIEASTGRPSTYIAAGGFGLFRYAVPGNRRFTLIKATECDQRFDAGEDMSAEVDWTRVHPLNVEARRVEVLDRQAQKLGITRQALIKIWIAERLEG